MRKRGASGLRKGEWPNRSRYAAWVGKGVEQRRDREKGMKHAPKVTTPWSPRGTNRGAGSATCGDRRQETEIHQVCGHEMICMMRAGRTDKLCTCTNAPLRAEGPHPHRIRSPTTAAPMREASRFYGAGVCTGGGERMHPRILRILPHLAEPRGIVGSTGYREVGSERQLVRVSARREK